MEKNRYRHNCEHVRGLWKFDEKRGFLVCTAASVLIFILYRPMLGYAIFYL